MALYPEQAKELILVNTKKWLADHPEIGSEAAAAIDDISRRIAATLDRRKSDKLLSPRVQDVLCEKASKAIAQAKLNDMAGVPETMGKMVIAGRRGIGTTLDFMLRHDPAQIILGSLAELQEEGDDGPKVIRPFRVPDWQRLNVPIKGYDKKNWGRFLVLLFNAMGHELLSPEEWEAAKKKASGTQLSDKRTITLLFERLFDGRDDVEVEGERAYFQQVTLDSLAESQEEGEEGPRLIRPYTVLNWKKLEKPVKGYSKTKWGAFFFTLNKALGSELLSEHEQGQVNASILGTNMNDRKSAGLLIERLFEDRKDVEVESNISYFQKIALDSLGTKQGHDEGVTYTISPSAIGNIQQCKLPIKGYNRSQRWVSFFYFMFLELGREILTEDEYEEIARTTKSKRISSRMHAAILLDSLFADREDVKLVG